MELKPNVIFVASCVKLRQNKTKRNTVTLAHIHVTKNHNIPYLLFSMRNDGPAIKYVSLSLHQHKSVELLHTNNYI